MGFSAPMTGLTDEERQRREAAALAASMQGAGGQAVDALSRAQAMAEKEKEGHEKEAQLAAENAARSEHFAAERAHFDAEGKRADTDQQLRMREAENTRVRNTQLGVDEDRRLRMLEDNQKEGANARAKLATDKDAATARARVPGLVQGAIDKGLDDADTADLVKTQLGIDVHPLEIRAMRSGLQTKEDTSEANIDLTASKAEKNRRVGAPKPDKGAAKTAATENASRSEMDDTIRAADELEQIYARGGVGTGVAASGGVGPLASDDLVRAKQLSTQLAFGVPKAFSKSKRLNDTEFKKGLSDIVGSPTAMMTNEQKLGMAHNLGQDLRKMRDEIGGTASVSAPTPAAPTVAPLRLTDPGSLMTPEARQARIDELIRKRQAAGDPTADDEAP